MGLKWFSNSIDSFEGKDDAELLKGFWIVEIGEMSAYNRSDLEVIKGFPSRCDDQYRAAYGLNLQNGGNHVIWFGLNWSLELYQQANKRLHRQGQTEKVIFHHIVVEGGVDEDVMAALEGKGATQDRLMNALKARIENKN